MVLCDRDRAAIVEATDSVTPSLRVDDHISGRLSRSEFSNAWMPSTVDSCMKAEGSTGTLPPPVRAYGPVYMLLSVAFLGSS